MKKKICFFVPEYQEEHILLKGPRKMVAFRFPEKLIKELSSHANKRGIDKTRLIEIAILSVIESNGAKK